MDDIDIASEVALHRLDDKFYEVVDGKRQVYVYQTPTRVRILATDDTLDGGPVLPGFQLRVDSLFVPMAPANLGAQDLANFASPTREPPNAPDTEIIGRFPFQRAHSGENS
jgi:hypothetical protein